MTKQIFFIGSLAIVVVALVAALMGAAGGMGTPARIPPVVTTGPEDADETFYVVAYHWDWAVFTEDGTQIDQIRVEKGTTIEIYAVNLHAMTAIMKLPMPVSEAIMAFDASREGGHDMAGMAGMDEPADAHTEDEPADAHTEDEPADAHTEDEPADAHTEDEPVDEGMAGMEGMDGAEEPLWPYMNDHGFLIDWFGVSEYLSGDADEPVRVVFTADRIGEYEFVCTNFCGLANGADNGDDMEGMAGMDEPADAHTEDEPADAHTEDEPVDEGMAGMEGMEGMDGDDNGEGHINMPRIMLIVT